MADFSYVKFQRGTTAAYERIKADPDLLDQDSLYFVYDSINATRGVLYLGDKLISGSVSESGEPVESLRLSDLLDVALGAGLINNQVLAYQNGVWKNVDIAQIIADSTIGIMQGATESADGKAGLVPVPKMENRNQFLRGDGTWQSIPSPIFDSNAFETILSPEVGSLEQQITIRGILEATPGSVLTKTEDGSIAWRPVINNALHRKIVDSIESINPSAEGADQYIYLVAKGNETNDQYEEYMVIEGKIERVGSFNVDLSQYVTKEEFSAVQKEVFGYTPTEPTGDFVPGLKQKVETLETTLVETQKGIGDLSQLINKGSTVVEEITNINTQIKNITDALTWREI